MIYVYPHVQYSRFQIHRDTGNPDESCSNILNSLARTLIASHVRNKHLLQTSGPLCQNSLKILACTALAIRETSSRKTSVSTG